jgi:hypothetical protein
MYVEITYSFRFVFSSTLRARACRVKKEERTKKIDFYCWREERKMPRNAPNFRHFLLASFALFSFPPSEHKFIIIFANKTQSAYRANKQATSPTFIQYVNNSLEKERKDFFLFVLGGTINFSSHRPHKFHSVSIISIQ